MNIDQTLWMDLAEGRRSPRETIAALVAAGHGEAEARELVFFAVGGGDLVEIGDDGVKRYSGGKTVAEVERAMRA